MKRTTLLVSGTVCAFAGGVLFSSCATTELILRAPASVTTLNPTRQLRAGLSKVDITPPPGLATIGYGPESPRVKGYGMRLYARGLVLEDPDGEQLALVLVDLDMISSLVHRKAAQLIHARTGLGADRLIVSATHTHSAPGHYLGAPAYDELGAGLPGYDARFADSVAAGIARAVLEAYDDLGPARAAWGYVNVWNKTRVRHNEAMRRNPKRFMVSDPNAPTGESLRYIDPQLNMLRVDKREASGRYRRAGSYIIFPVHGTAITAPNALYDGDIHAVVMQQLEKRIVPGQVEPGNRPTTIHLFANGAEGDIIANWSQETRCPAAMPKVVFAPTGLRRHQSPLDFIREKGDLFPSCIQQSAKETVELGVGIADEAVRLFERLEADIANPAAEQLDIGRAYRVVQVGKGTPRLCEPHIGGPAMGGGEGGFTRALYLPVFKLLAGTDTMATKSKQLSPAEECQGNKNWSKTLEFLLAGDRPFPLAFQMAVLRIGDRTIGTVPGEPTTNAGARMRRAMAVDSAAPDYQRFLILGLANSYIHYVNTAYEYTAQLYDGAATLYGPSETEVLAAHLRSLANELRDAGKASPPAEVADIPAAHRGAKRIMPRPSKILPDVKRELHTCWRADTLVAQWNDLPPGDFYPAAGPVLRVDRQDADGSIRMIAWDDDPDLEVWYLREEKKEHRYEGRYAVSRIAGSTYRVTLLPRKNLGVQTGDFVEFGASRCGR
jgi:neutral ceramidase